MRGVHCGRSSVLFRPAPSRVHRQLKPSPICRDINSSQASTGQRFRSLVASGFRMIFLLGDSTLVQMASHVHCTMATEASLLHFGTIMHFPKAIGGQNLGSAPNTLGSGCPRYSPRQATSLSCIHSSMRMHPRRTSFYAAGRNCACSPSCFTSSSRSQRECTAFEFSLLPGCITGNAPRGAARRWREQSLSSFSLLGAAS